MPGKVDRHSMQAQLKQLETEYGIEWQDYRLSELFEVGRGNIFNQKKLIPDSKGITFIAQNDCNNGFVNKVQKQLHRVFNGNSLIVGRQTGVVYYQENDFITTDGVLVLSAIRNFIKNNCIGLFIASILSKKLGGSFGYTNTVSASKLNKITIHLPTTCPNGEVQIAFDFMEAFIATLKAERLATLKAERLATLKAYLTVTGLTDTTLTPAEQATLKNLDALAWGTFRIEELFDHIVQGRRLKKQDQITGILPFVMAGITNTGVVNYIGNDTRVFPKNSLTVDIFGNVFYRSYEYGMGDDTGAYWNEDDRIPKFAMLYIATTMQKYMAGKFDYGHKLRSSRSLDFKIKLPITEDGTPDYDTMNLVVSALQKVVIQGVVSYLDERIEKTSELV